MPATSLERGCLCHFATALELSRPEPRSVLASPRARNYPVVNRFWRIQPRHPRSITSVHPAPAPAAPRSSELASALRRCAELPALLDKCQLRIHDLRHSGFPAETACL